MNIEKILLAIVASAWIVMAVIVTASYYRSETLVFMSPPLSGEAETFSGRDLFGEKLKLLESDMAWLDNCLILQGIFVLIGFFALKVQSERLELPILKLGLPRSWILYIVPVALIIIWLQFGFLLDDSINLREEAFNILQTFHSRLDERLFRGYATLLNDSGFVDAWFMLFRPSQSIIDTNFVAGTAIFFSVVFGGLLGFAHAMTVTLFLVANRLHADQMKLWTLVGRSFMAATPLLLLGLILLSHWQFFAGGKNPNWFQAVVALFAFVGTLLIHFTKSPSLRTAGDVPLSVEKQS